LAGRALRGEPCDAGQPPAADASTLVDELSGSAWGHLRRRLADSSIPKLQTALRHLARFERAVKGQRPKMFVVPTDAGGQAALLHNEWTLVLFVEWLARWRSPRTRELLAVDTISEYVSMCKQELSVLFGFAITGVPTRLPAVIKGLRRERPKKDRRKRRGIRRSHLRAAWRKSSSMRSDAPAAVNLWAAAVTAWQGLCRGGEVAAGTGGRKGRADDLRRLPSRADLSFGESKGGRYAQVMMRPIKKRSGELAEKVPLLFEEGDGGGADTFAALERLDRLDPVRLGDRARTPLFRVGKAALTVDQLRRFAKKLMKAAGQRGAKVGAHSFRIGGATELADQGASQLLLQAKGRWASDIGRIYARMTRRAQLAASRLMQRRGGRDLEEIFPSFAQAA
jgi:hypothetical protein